jgi:hypothetical protein
VVHTCTRCELRFATEPELRQHLVIDHAADPEAFERNRYPATASTFRPLYEEAPSTAAVAGRRYLVVANQTLGGAALDAKIHELVGGGPASLYVVVPATPSWAYQGAADEGRTEASATDEKGLGQAHWRLRQAIDKLRAAGVEAEGEVGPPDPFTAVEQVLRRQEFDEVILSTLPASASRWIGLDLPRRLERSFRVPVTVVTPGFRLLVLFTGV